jgi:hypothetical protein
MNHDVNKNNVKNVIRIFRSLYIMVITKYKNVLRKTTLDKFLIKKTRFDYMNKQSTNLVK